MPSITNLYEKKMHNVNDLVKKADYDALMKDIIKRKYFTTSDYNKFTNI